MRTITPTERALIGSARYEIHCRVEVQDATGVWRDLTALGTVATGPVNWLRGVRWAADIDSPVLSGTLTLRRDATVNGTTLSLAPFLAASGLNTLTGSYSPLLNAGRQLRIKTATVAPGTSAASVSASMRPMLVGKIDSIEWAAEDVTVQFRDTGAYLLDAMVRDPLTLGADDGSVSAGMAMQAVLDSLPATPAGVFTLYEPALILFAIKPTQQQPGPALEILRNIALQAGGDFRFLFDAADALRPTFAQPDRTKTAPDFTLPPSEYLAVHGMSISDADVRTQAEGVFRDSATRTWRTVRYEHAAALAEFGLRFIRLKEDASSYIDTEAEEVRFLTDILNDLALPKATHAVESLYLPFVALGDVVDFPANGVHYDAPQTLAVVGYEHTLGANGPGTGRTTLMTRGKPAGAYREWLEREGGGVRVAQPGPAPEFLGAYAEASSFGGQTGQGGTWVLWRFDKRTQRIRIHALESPTYPAPTPDIHDENTLAKDITRLPGTRAGADAWGAISFIATTPGYSRTAVCYGVGEDGALSARKTFRVTATDPTTPTGVGDPGDFSALAVERRPGGNVVTLTRGSVGTAAHAWAIIFRNRTPIDVVPITTGAGAGSTLASGATITWEDPGLDTTTEQFDYEVCAWSYGISGPKRAAGVDPVPLPPAFPPPPINPTPIIPVPPPSLVAAPQFGTRSGVQTPYYGDAVDHDGAGWVRVVWDRPSGAAGVALEKTYRSDNTGWFEVTYSTLSHYDNRVSGAYESGYYRLVAKDAGFGYLAISAPVFYRSPFDVDRTAGTGTTATGGGGGRTQFAV